ncbi:DeoR/GlpR family DNA-binding transcription regulator [Tabrizicola sp.]|uniref:DeoR/GlpR family DNA-binding transcription regulator n=1 Tax=Tabrizicola sp. TaxID=2005166 RepID=UPI003F2F0C52
MLTSQRKALLLDRLAAEGRLVASDLAAELAVSEDTIRRDLRDLAADGRLLRVHGGALPSSPTHLPLVRRMGTEAEAKARLARAAAGLIQPGQVVIIDGGTTHLALVAVLPSDLACKVVTHSPGVAAAFEGHEGIEVVLFGGRLFRHSMVAMGAATVAGYAGLRADLCLLGVTGVHPEAGLTTGDAEEAALKRVMIAAAAEVVVLATPDKLGAVSPWGIGRLDQLSRLVTVGERPGWLPESVDHLAA